MWNNSLLLMVTTFLSINTVSNPYFTIVYFITIWRESSKNKNLVVNLKHSNKYHIEASISNKRDNREEEIFNCILKMAVNLNFCLSRQKFCVVIWCRMQLFQPLIIINVGLLQVRMSVWMYSSAAGGLSRVSKGCPVHPVLIHSGQ